MSDEKSNLLIVEDSVQSQKLMGFYLRNNYGLSFASSVREAQKYLEKNSIDAVLLDISLSGEEDGLDLVRHMRKTENNLPVVAITGFNTRNIQEECFRAGCDDYMAKPIFQKDLLDKLQEYLPN